MSFPYSFNIFRNMKRNFSIIKWITQITLCKKFNRNISNFEWMPMKIIMNINLSWRLKLFQNLDSTLLFQKILERFSTFGSNQNFLSIFIFIPQKDDVEFIKFSAWCFEKSEVLSFLSFFERVKKRNIFCEKQSQFYDKNKKLTERKIKSLIKT